jgi:membrane-bound ClpP family serine protease
MSIGSGIALFVIGAILAFAVNVQLDVINLDLIGYLLMGAGAIIFIIGLVLMARRRESTTTTRSAVDPASGEAVQRRTTTSNDDPLV